MAELSQTKPPRRLPQVHDFQVEAVLSLLSTRQQYSLLHLILLTSRIRISTRSPCPTKCREKIREGRSGAGAACSIIKAGGSSGISAPWNLPSALMQDLAVHPS